MVSIHEKFPFPFTKRVYQAHFSVVWRRLEGENLKKIIILENIEPNELSLSKGLCCDNNFVGGFRLFDLAHLSVVFTESSLKLIFSRCQPATTLLAYALLLSCFALQLVIQLGKLAKYVWFLHTKLYWLLHLYLWFVKRTTNTHTSQCHHHACVTRISKDGDFPMASHAPSFLLKNPHSRFP